MSFDFENANEAQKKVVSKTEWPRRMAAGLLFLCLLSGCRTAETSEMTRYFFHIRCGRNSICWGRI